MYLLLIYFIINLLPVGPSVNIKQEKTLRPSITFILGEDEEDKNPYYSLAKQYYLYHPSHKDNIFIDTCRSLVSVRNHLAKNLPKNATAWGEITVVVHSNQWTGISVPVVAGGERTTINSLFQNIQNQQFAALPNTIVDEETVIDFKACGLGSNKDLLQALATAFGGFDDVKPQVRSSENFIYYAPDRHQHIQSKEFRPYYAFYRTAYRPAGINLAKQLQERYPTCDIDWLTAMQNKQPRGEGDIFHYRFNVPIEWHVYVDKENANLDFNSITEKITFVKTQPDLIKLLNYFDIPIDKFRWTFEVEKEEGVATVLIKGKATVLCVLEEV